MTQALQAVRALVNAQHAVCFGLGDGNDHLIINKLTGEVKRMRDDGVNYLQDLIIVPPDPVDSIAPEFATIHQSTIGKDSGGAVATKRIFMGRANSSCVHAYKSPR